MGNTRAGAASLRHVGLVALEALLVAAIVSVAAMTLAAASQSDGLASVNAGRGHANLQVSDGVFGEPTTATANPGGDGTWVSVTCQQGDKVVLTAWSQVDSANKATFMMGPTPSWSGGAATCTAEEGYFSNGRWRVQDKTSFDVAA